jgi:tRNA A-37 threonylcarbamoyl transferase component Bud32
MRRRARHDVVNDSQTDQDGYTNSTYLENQAVVKTYSGADAQDRFLTELAMYRQLQFISFMPELLSYDQDTLTIKTRHIADRHAQDLLEDHCDSVPLILGKLVRALQVIAIDTIGEQKGIASNVLVYGDFGPQNLLFAHGSFSEPCLVEWEWAHFGDKSEDISLAEWIIRMHYAASKQMIASLYKGFLV